MKDADGPAFLSLEQVMVLHRRSLAEHGGIDGARDPGAIESALASAQNTWLYADGDVHDIAAAYAFISPRRRHFWTATSARRFPRPSLS